MTAAFISKLVQSKDVSLCPIHGFPSFQLSTFLCTSMFRHFFLKELMYTFLLRWTILNLVNTYLSQAQ